MHEQLLSNEEIEKCFELKNKIDTLTNEDGSTRATDIEKEIQKTFPKYISVSGVPTKRDKIINLIIMSSGNIKYNTYRLHCPKCKSKYVVQFTFGCLSKELENEKTEKFNPLTYAKYGCVITGKEEKYQCLSCGHEWGNILE